MNALYARWVGKAHGSAFKVCPFRTVMVNEEHSHPAPLAFARRMGKYLALEGREGRG